MEIEGKAYSFKNAEAAFQAHKDPSTAAQFQNLSGKEAKFAGRRVKLRPDWEYVKDDVMRSVIDAKFKNPELLDKLKSITGEICEDNTWNDAYWGKCNGVGENKLGQILMETRDKSLAPKRNVIKPEPNEKTETTQPKESQVSASVNACDFDPFEV